MVLITRHWSSDIDSILPSLPAEHRGDLWLYAGIATSLGIPFNLLMMAPPTPILQPTAKLVDPYHARRPRSPAAHPTTGEACASQTVKYVTMLLPMGHVSGPTQGRWALATLCKPSFIREFVWA